MKKSVALFVTIFSVLLSCVSCMVDKYNSYTKNIEIVNHSSSRLAGSYWMGTNPFDLAPGDTFTISFDVSETGVYPSASDIRESGPSELIIDGKRYTLKSSANAVGFFDLLRWTVTQVEKGFDLKLEITDENIEQMLRQADLVE